MLEGARRIQGIEGAVECGVRHGADVLGYDPAHVAKRLQNALALVDRSRPAGHERHKVSPCRSSGMNGSGGAICQAGKPPNASGASTINSR